jgi:hypothetical protein
MVSDDLRMARVKLRATGIVRNQSQSMNKSIYQDRNP